MSNTHKQPPDSDQQQQCDQGDLLDQIGRLIKQKGCLRLSHSEDDGGMGHDFCATLGGEWPFCYGSTPSWAIRRLVSENKRLEREALQKRLNEIDASASL